MIGVFTAEQIRTAEQAHARELANGTLMQRASHGLATAVIRAMRTDAADQQRRGRILGSRVVVLVGTGNNGGDALFAAATLAARGACVTAIPMADRYHSAAAATLQRANGRITGPADQASASSVLAQAEVVIDGILGIGAHGPLREPARSLIRQANAASALRIAVDIPSGVDADTGFVAEVALRADLTVTFAAMKPGLLMTPGAGYAGQVTVVDIGIDDALHQPVAWILDEADVARWLPQPGFDEHKYRRGVVGVAAGSRDYRGAALLCVDAALSGPTGMTVLLDPGDAVADLVIGRYPEVVRADRMTGTVAGRVTGWACGPGFTTGDADRTVVADLLQTVQPLVLDAGALTLLAADAGLRHLLRTRSGPTVLTPHDGEFERLGGDCGPDRMTAARALAAELDAVIVRKGPGTVIAAPDGSCFVDRAGSSALATAGSGDVLTGCIASLLAGAGAHGRLDGVGTVAQVAAAGCWLHGMAGRLAGQQGFATASSIASELHAVTGRMSRLATAPAAWDDSDMSRWGRHAR